MSELTLNEQFVNACKDNDLEKVKELLGNPTVDIHYLEDSGLLQGCKEGHYQIVEYLLSSPDLKEHSDIHAQNDYALILSCEKGNFDVLDFLLNSPKLKERISLIDNFRDVYYLIDEIADNMKDQAYAHEHGDRFVYKLVKYIVGDSGLEKNTSSDLNSMIINLTKYHKDIYKIYKAKKAAWELELSLGVNEQVNKNKPKI